MTLTVLASRLTFPEAPRWRDDRLVFADFYSHWVGAVDLAGHCERIVEVPGQPSGIGWLPDTEHGAGDMLVVSMRDQRVLRWNGRQLSLHADLSNFARGPANDMIVTAGGRAYVGNFGFDPATETPRPTCLVRIEPDGTIGVAANDLAFPNGMALLDDERRLVVAESIGQCLTVFDVAGDGSLSHRRILARLDGCQPDGICVDHDGTVLVTTMTCNRLLRFSGSGELLENTLFDSHLWAVAVSPSGDVLLCTADHYVENDCLAASSGKIQRWRQ